MKYYSQKIKDNIWNPSYYEKILTRSLASSFRYYFKMILGLSLIGTSFISIVYLPKFITVVRQVVASFAENYPAELKIYFNNGQASINMPEPVVITSSLIGDRILNKTEKKLDYLENLFVIDTRTNFNLAEFSNYRALFVLKKDSFAGINSSGEISVSKIPTSKMVVSGNDVKNFANKLQSIILIVAPLGVLLIYFLGVLFLLFALGYLILIAFLVWFLLYLNKRDLTFKQSLSVTLHACTLPLMVNLIIIILFFNLSINFLFLVTAILLIIYLNLIRQPRIPTSTQINPVIPPDEIGKNKK